MLQFINKTLRHIFTVVQVQAYDCLHGVMCRANFFRDPKQGSSVYKCPLPFFLRLHLVITWCFCGAMWDWATSSSTGNNLLNGAQWCGQARFCLLINPHFARRDKPSFMVHTERKDSFKFSSGKTKWKKQTTFLTSFIQPETFVDVISTFHKLSYAYMIWWPHQSAENLLSLFIILRLAFLFIQII